MLGGAAGAHRLRAPAGRAHSQTTKRAIGWQTGFGLWVSPPETEGSCLSLSNAIVRSGPGPDRANNN